MVRVILIFAIFYVAGSCARTIDNRHYYDVTTNSGQQLIVDEDYPVEYQIYLFEKPINAGTVYRKSGKVEPTEERQEVKKKQGGTKTRCIGAVTTMALCF